MGEEGKSLLEEKLSELEKQKSNLIFKVLVIDDDVHILKLFERYLQSMGFQVLKATNPFTGIALAVKHNPALILLDIYLPEVQGDVILKILKNIEITASIPIIIVSANLNKDLLNSTYSEGAGAFLSKPFTKEDLVRNVRKLLEHNI